MPVSAGTLTLIPLDRSSANRTLAWQRLERDGAFSPQERYRPFPAPRESLMKTVTAGLAIATVALALQSSPVRSSEQDWAPVAQALGKNGTEMPGGVYRIGLPRTDRSEERRVGKECRSRWSP